MRNYLEMLFEEKEIWYQLDIEWHFWLTTDDLIDFVCNLPDQIQIKIRNMFVKIDYKNWDIAHYIRYLSEWMVKCI